MINLDRNRGINILSEINLGVTPGSGTNIAGYTDTAGNFRQVIIPGDNAANIALMPQGIQLTSNGGPTTTTIAAGTNSVTVVKNTAGRLCRILVTTLGSAQMTLYDNASAASGTIIGVVAASAAVGTFVDCQMPAANGITASASASNPAVTISWV